MKNHIIILILFSAFSIAQEASTGNILEDHDKAVEGILSDENKKQTEIKRLIIESIQELVDKRIIKQLFKIIQKDGSLITQNNLTSKLITKSKVI